MSLSVWFCVPAAVALLLTLFVAGHTLWSHLFHA
jgi:hypothetical protein